MDILSYEIRCKFCKRKEATKLCDYPVGEWTSPHMIIKYGKRITCDNQMCDECAVNLGYEMDFCPDCMERLKNK